MAAGPEVKPPSGFVLDTGSGSAPQPPPGFVLDRQTTSPEEKPSWFDHAVNAVVDYGKGVNRTLNPFSQESRDSATALVTHPVDTITNMMNAQGELAQRSKQSFRSGDYLQGVRHAISYLIPVLGPAIDEAGNKAGQGKMAEGLGEATGIGISAGMTGKSFQEPPAPTYAPQPPNESAIETYRQSLKRG